MVFSGVIKVRWGIFVLERCHYKAVVRLEHVRGNRYRVGAVVSVYDVTRYDNRGIVSIKLILKISWRI